LKDISYEKYEEEDFLQLARFALYSYCHENKQARDKVRARKPLMFEPPCSIFFQLEIVLNWVFIVRENSRV
jgi:hypothetical protein